MTSSIARFGLPSGASCELSAPKLPLVRGYYALSLVEASPGEADLVALWTLAHRLARDLASRTHGDPECFSLLFNAARTRRKPWAHVHIILARSPAQKRWVLLCLSLKRFLRWRRWPGVRSLASEGQPTAPRPLGIATARQR